MRYIPLDRLDRIETEILIGMSTGGALSFSPLRRVPVTAALRIVWVQGVPKPADLDVVAQDFVYVASSFLRRVCIERWGLAAARLFVDALELTGPGMDCQDFVHTLETKIDKHDLGLGTLLSFSSTNHQASHTVWGSMLNDDGSFSMPFVWTPETRISAGLN